MAPGTEQGLKHALVDDVDQGRLQKASDADLRCPFSGVTDSSGPLFFKGSEPGKGQGQGAAHTLQG